MYTLLEVIPLEFHYMLNYCVTGVLKLMLLVMTKVNYSVSFTAL